MNPHCSHHPPNLLHSFIDHPDHCRLLRRHPSLPMTFILPFVYGYQVAHNIGRSSFQVGPSRQVLLSRFHPHFRLLILLLPHLPSASEFGQRFRPLYLDGGRNLCPRWGPSRDLCGTPLGPTFPNAAGGPPQHHCDSRLGPTFLPSIAPSSHSTLWANVPTQSGQVTCPAFGR